MKIGAIIKDSLILFLVTLILGLALSATKVATQGAIDKANEDAKIKAFNIVCHGYESSDDITYDVVGAGAGFKATLNTNEEGGGAVLRAKDKDGNVIGYIVMTTAMGFGGPLNLITGFDTEGKITGVQYANTPSETPGLGMKTTKQDFLDSFLKHDSSDVEQVDTITSATISSTAFKEAVKCACMYADRAKQMDRG